jgi:hypothetical protein
VLRSILAAGMLLKPGDKLPDGTILKSTKCADRQDKVIYTSPTVKYAGLKFYAEPQPYGLDGMAASVVLQLRQRPGHFEQQGETMAFEKAREDSRGQGTWRRSARTWTLPRSNGSRSKTSSQSHTAS